jgi:hypothetical protein
MEFWTHVGHRFVENKAVKECLTWVGYFRAKPLHLMISRGLAILEGLKIGPNGRVLDPSSTQVWTQI